MNHVVVYILYPWRRDEQLMQAVFNTPVVFDGVLPFVSPPLNDGEAQAALDQLRKLGARLGEHAAFIQAADEHVPAMPEPELLSMLQQDPEWIRLLREFEVDRPYRLTTREFPRCWVVLNQAVPHGLPPGLGFVVDKFTRTIFSRRFADVLHVLQGLGEFVDWRALAEAMSEISEQAYYAGWMDGLEFRLWAILQGGPREYGRTEVTDPQVARLRELSDWLGGWVRFDDEAPFEEFVELERWQTLYDEWLRREPSTAR